MKKNRFEPQQHKETSCSLPRFLNLRKRLKNKCYIGASYKPYNLFSILADQDCHIDMRLDKDTSSLKITFRATDTFYYVPDASPPDPFPRPFLFYRGKDNIGSTMRVQMLFDLLRKNSSRFYNTAANSQSSWTGCNFPIISPAARSQSSSSSLVWWSYHG